MHTETDTQIKDYGFAISTSSQDTIENNAEEIEIELTDENWQKINDICIQLELDLIDLIKTNYNGVVMMRDEGHDKGGELIGTISVYADSKIDKIIRDVIEHEPLRTSSGSLNNIVYTDKLYRNFADKVLIDVDVDFFTDRTE